MSFQQLKININSTRAEKLSEIFFDLGALSVSIEDQYEGTDLEQPIFNEPGMVVDNLWEHSTVTVLLNQDDDVLTITKEAQQQLGSEFDFQIEKVDDQDWVRLTQSQFEPIEITPKLFIVPSWHTIPNENATGIILDPGLAFGTGSHPTTFMCLKYLSENVTTQLSVLDYGCGSGILAITAKKLGANKVDGVDIDPQAIESSIYNAQNNIVEVDFFLPHTFEAKQYDLVVANILSNPLRMLAPALAANVKKGGKIVLSGILADQIEEMSDIYNQWFDIKTYLTIESWACLEGIKK